MKNLFKTSDSAFESVIIPIALFILGLIILLYRDIVKYSLFIFSGIALLYGLLKLILFYKKPENKKDVLTGIIYILVGMIISIVTFFAYGSILQVILRFCLSALFIYTAITRIIQSFKQKKEYKKIYIITSSLLIILAIILAFIDFDISTTGFFISIYAVIEVVGYILINKKKVDNSKILEANVLSEKVDSNE